MPHLDTELEEIFTDNERSISLMVNPNLSDFFFWHFHPEYELVFIRGANGTRHVGEHISRFRGSDLVLIGPNIPHLNFDYGIRTPYEKRVLHLRQNFFSGPLETVPETAQIQALLKESEHGLAFGVSTQKKVWPRLNKIKDLDPFGQFMEVLDVLQVLAEASDIQKLHSDPVRNQHTTRDHQRLKTVYSYVEEHYHQKIDLRQVAERCNLSYEAFCRYFKKMTRLTFTEFVNQYRIGKAKRMLLTNRTISEICYECGYESLSYFNRVFKKLTGYSPSAFRKNHS